MVHLRSIWDGGTDLAEAGEPFGALLTGLPDAALLLAPPDRLVSGNPALQQALGPAVSLHRGMSVARLFAPANRPELAAWLRGGARPEELRLTAPDDQAGAPVAPCLVPLPDGHSVLILRDLAQRQIMAARMAESDRLQALGTLAGGIAHDFNNLLGVILGAAEDGLRTLTPDSPAAQEFGHVREAAERGAGLVRQLLAYARQQVLAPQQVPLNQAVSGMARLLRPLLGRNIALELALEEPGRLVRIDPSELDRVLMNLAMNARQAMPDGGKLRFSTGRCLLLQPLHAAPEPVPPGRWTVLEVADTGSGIAPELLPRIFEPFFTSRAGQGGTGMGLATVHGIIRQSGGYLTVESHPGRGTRFRILLPRLEEQPAGPVPAAAADPAEGAAGKGALLLVEDEAPLRRLAERALCREGWNVTAAEDAEAALALVEEGLRPALVVSDVMMPGMDGLDLALRLHQRFPGLPILLTSGYAPSVVEKGLGEGGICFLSKPYGPKQLAEAVAALMAR